MTFVSQSRSLLWQKYITTIRLSKPKGLLIGGDAFQTTLSFSGEAISSSKVAHDSCTSTYYSVSSCPVLVQSTSNVKYIPGTRF